jgi:hypothetical protein
VELGAQFLHGKNELFDLAQREGMLAGMSTVLFITIFKNITFLCT